ncbi:MAG: carboxypeptidase-like regulatory domain-containing protein [Mangrovibacterium sp.]
MREITFEQLFRVFLFTAFFLLVQGADAQGENKVYPKESLSFRVERISREYNVNIIYNPNLAEVEMPELIVKQSTLDWVLAESIVTTGLTVERTANSIILRSKDKPVTEAGTGSLKGRIVEAETSEPLPGATIQVVGSQFGTTSDLNGYYLLEKVPEGKQTIEVSFIGYTKRRLDVRIRASETVTCDVTLSVDNQQLDDVVVKGIRRERSSVPHASELLVTQEIKNLQIVASGISSELISKSADRNAAQVVQRVSGVSIVDDKFVIVRGLNPRYNLTYLNDNVAPSTETNSRAFALDLIPSRVIDKIIVQKTASPENQADATGGVIKIYTKDAKAVKHFDLEFQLGIRPGTTFNADFLTYNGGKWDWLGFDDGTRALPSAVPGYGSLTLANLQPTEYAKAFNPTLYYGKKTALPNMQLTVNYYDAWNVFGKTLSSLASFSYKNDNHFSEKYKQEGSYYRSVGSTDKTSNEDRSSNTVQLNLLQNFTFSFNENNKLFFKNFLLQQGIDATVVRISHPTHQYAQTASLDKDITLSYNQRFLYAGNLGGEHSFGKDKRHELQWNGGYTFSRQETPDQRVIRLKGIMPEYTMGDAELQWWARGYDPTSSDDLNTVPLDLGIISRLWSRNSEGVYNGSLDYTFRPLKWIAVKTGTFHQWKKRTMYRRIFTVHEGDIDPTVFLTNVRQGNYTDANIVRFREQNLTKVWTADYLNDEYTGLHVVDCTSGSDMYVGTEQNNSGYLALTLSPGKWIELHGGLRYEYNRQKIGAVIPRNSGTATPINNPILVDNAAGLWLPSVNLSLKPTEKWVLRTAYGQTVNRTEFREVSPFRELDFENNTILNGEPGLKSATVENYDLRLEFYPNIDKGDAITAGVFYKDIIHPIERVNTSNRIHSMFPSISYNNAASAVVKGVEVELRKSLDFIPLGLFRNLSVVANGSLIDSKARYEKVSANSVKITERPLQGQAPYLVNAGLYYDNAGWGSKLSVIYNYVAENIYAVGTGGGDDSGGGGIVVGPSTRGSLIELPRHLLDFSYTQRIGKGMQVKFTVQNILDAKMEMAEDFNATYKYETLVETAVDPSDPDYRFPIRYEGDNIASSYRPGRYFSLSFSYSF